MKKSVVAMKMHPGDVELQGLKFKMKLPEGCIGILMCFESKKAARAFWGNDVPLTEVEKKVEDTQK